MAEGSSNVDSAGHDQFRNNRVEAVYRSTLAISTELSLDSALQKIVDAARELVGARYGALGVIDEERRRLTRFIVSGISQEEIRAIEHWPRGLGLLGELIHFPRPLRVKDMGRDPRSVGFPPNHPPMGSFLGVPVMLRRRVLGNFYMTQKEGAIEFSQDDEEMLSLFAAHAAIALENARLYTETDTRLREKVLEVERAERRARFLAELGARLLRLGPGEELDLKVIVEKVAEPLGDATALYLVDPEDPAAMIDSAVFHRIPARQEAARRVIEGSWERLRELALVRRRSSLASSSAEEGADSAFDVQSLRESRFSGALSVPIATRQTTYGLLISLSSHPLTLAEEDRRFALLIADRLGAALESARLHRKERDAREKVQELADLAQHRAMELEAVLDTMAEPVYVVDTGGTLIRMNRAYDRLVGDSREPAADRQPTWLDLRGEGGQPLPPRELPWARAIRGESFTNKVFLLPADENNQERYLSISGAPIRDASGRIVAAVNVARDVTEMKELDRQKDEFISVASHELKTPLTVIKGYSQVLLQKMQGNPEKAGEIGMASRILEQTNRMTVLADRLLDVSRIQFGRLQLDKRPADLAALVRDISERMQVSTDSHPIRVSAEEGVPAQVDSERVEQVLANLISNATRYSPRGSEIDVALEVQNGKALISVRDRGPGIPREHQPNIFKRFYRASAGQEKRGLGLGLYVSKGIVEAHGGKIWFDTQEGQGTTFFVQLPTGE